MGDIQRNLMQSKYRLGDHFNIIQTVVLEITNDMLRLKLRKNIYKEQKLIYEMQT